MFHVKSFLYFILIHFIDTTPQLNLYYTDGVTLNNTTLQHNCLRAPITEEPTAINHQVISYCLDEVSSSDISIGDNSLFPSFTFDQLSKQNITTQQLYEWSAPIDLIEQYQVYLNQLTTTNSLSLASQVFYNCTLPRFGPMCQYEFVHYDTYNSSLYEMITDFYATHEYNPSTLTCYMHLECNRGASSSCLDWSEICDGRINCLNGGIDEEHCWELEINQCEDNEYRCKNGQCIPQSFYHDPNESADCIDASDVSISYIVVNVYCFPSGGPSFGCEDMVCDWIYSTSSCTSKRKDLLAAVMYSNKNSFVLQDCLSAFICFINFRDSNNSLCDNNLCQDDECMNIIENTCPDMIYFPNVPVLFGHIYFAYKKDDLPSWTSVSIPPHYICYDTSDYDAFFMQFSNIFFNNMTCIDSKLVLPSWIFNYGPVQYTHTNSLSSLFKLLRRYHLVYNYTSEICNRTNMYQCMKSSKCISIYRFVDGVDDCPHMDDEDIAATNSSYLIEHYKKTHYYCQTTNKYIHLFQVRDDNCDCQLNKDSWCDDEYLDIEYLQQNVVFQHICDGFTDLAPKMIDGRNETDETECEQWECNNIYTRCNDVWNCLNGDDEIGCTPETVLNCSSDYRVCVSPDTNTLICLPIEKMNDGNVDCIGATDEVTRCGEKKQLVVRFDIVLASFYCMNQSKQTPCIQADYLCDGYNQCEHGDDEQFCSKDHFSTNSDSICYSSPYENVSDVEKFLCDYKVPIRDWGVINFQPYGMTYFMKSQVNKIENMLLSSSSILQSAGHYESRCHRGLELRIWLNNSNNSTMDACLCPPSYYGNQCQYQNQRISLTVKFQASPNSVQTPFAILISLIDDSDQKVIHSYEQITFLAQVDCQKKFNIYLLYSTRPKDPTKQYAIHIDIYEKLTLTYRGSLLLPIKFPFLPVHRLAFLIHIPRPDPNYHQICSNRLCIHGKCMKYVNHPQNMTFCQCNQGWSGKYCTIQHPCTCSSQSLCIGVSAITNRSICICPINRYGSRCYLSDTICERMNKNETCQNDGQCVSNIDSMKSNENFVCICKKGYSGDRCEIVDDQLILSFDKDIISSQQIFIHFIEFVSWLKSINYTVRTTTYRTIPIRQNSLTIYWSQSFHLVFIEFLNKNYYLAVIQNTSNLSVLTSQMIDQSNRCPHINELFTKTFIQWDLLRRIKYYHLPCQNQSLNLSCFYDDVHFCLCYTFEHKQKRLSNCFKFDHHITFDCHGQSECENGAQCLQDQETCPTTSLCICQPCYYGRRCQFTTSGFGLSLDAILGYQILSHLSLKYQPPIILFSLVCTILFTIAGYVNGILSMITFMNKSVREVGCGIYLLYSSIFTLLTMTMFGLKFFILLSAQMTVISNRLFLTIQCHSIDVLLQICLWMYQWLNALVAMERAYTTIKGARFVKKTSRKVAKLAILILSIIIIGSSVHDPIYRRLIDEENDTDEIKRIWCIISYPSVMKVYNSLIHICHFFGPFIINLISSIILLTRKSRQMAHAQPHRNYRELLREQVHQHKHLLAAPIALVILALPRLIITFVSKCMKSANGAWIFLIGYFISFVPVMLTFVVFILPSKFYKKQFNETITEYRTNIRRRFQTVL